MAPDITLTGDIATGVASGEAAQTTGVTAQVTPGAIDGVAGSVLEVSGDVIDGTATGTAPDATSVIAELATADATGVLFIAGSPGRPGQDGAPGDPGPPGDPGSVVDAAQQIEVPVPSTLWTLHHTLPFLPNITVVDSSRRRIEGGDVTYVDDTTITIEFTSAFAGWAYLS